MDASHELYAAAYRLAWASIIPFVVVALIALNSRNEIIDTFAGLLLDETMYGKM
jgi:hypothetical protein